jgi:hypothetical protein
MYASSLLSSKRLFFTDFRLNQPQAPQESIRRRPLLLTARSLSRPENTHAQSLYFRLQ